mmetsp:Transcript_37492/g.78515  ORF Transcript_37492/g.78515 Transcript_37492/m.78515 type:complete len:159 (-) Transcript_37492:1471-1947(-)
MYLRNKEGESDQSKLKTPKSKAKTSTTSKWSQDSDKTEDDADVDVDEMSFKGGLKKILQRLKEAAPKLKTEQFAALVNYHIDNEEVISMQQEAANLIRRSVDSEFHTHFDLPHNSSSANDVLRLGSMYLKALLWNWRKRQSLQSAEVFHQTATDKRNL